MMSAGLFVQSCNYIRLVALVMGLFLFLLAMFVRFRPLKKEKLYGEQEKRTRAVNLYIKGQQEEKIHLFWMLVICSVIVWYTGAILSTSYVTDFTVQKGEGCDKNSFEAANYADYNFRVLLPPALFAAGLLLNFLGTAVGGSSSKLFHMISYFLLLLGTVSVVLLYLNTDICTVSSKCM